MDYKGFEAAELRQYLSQKFRPMLSRDQFSGAADLSATTGVDHGTSRLLASDLRAAELKNDLRRTPSL
jgi:hypothetical protein